MSIWLQPTKATIWSVVDKGKYSEVRLSTGRKIQDTEPAQWANSNWSFVRFVGQAHDMVKDLGEKTQTRVTLESGNFSQEPYEKDGEKMYPKAPKLVVFKVTLVAPDAGFDYDKPPVVANNDDDIPF